MSRGRPRKPLDALAGPSARLSSPARPWPERPEPCQTGKLPPRGPALAAAAPLASDRGDRTLETDLDRRLGLPRALQAGLDGHPREGWRGAGHELASFWLDKHAHLDALSDDLRSMLATATARDAGDRAFAGAFAPRVQRFLGELDGHHRIEDGHYFPQLRRMEPSLAVGFDLLDADHEKIHEDIVALIDGANALLRILN
ncbi:MAG TPA: hemerythrin domain-containing protein, partial [Pseudomonadales bacterium]|nr:hemerythrin domain-containing protein [Pseudomonadales bacterium]